MQDMIASRRWNEYDKALVDFLSKESGMKKRAVRTALSRTDEWDFEEVLRRATLIE